METVGGLLALAVFLLMLKGLHDAWKWNNRK